MGINILKIYGFLSKNYFLKEKAYLPINLFEVSLIN